MTEGSIVYKHRQTGYVIILVCAVILIFVLSMFFFRENYSKVEFSVFIGIVLAVFILFHSLTVEISQASITVSLGAGLIRKKIPLHTVRESRIVTNKWYFGWGIRVIPRGFMFNVSGFSAVELALEHNNVFRIGTDDPEMLQQKLQEIIAHRGE